LDGPEGPARVDVEMRLKHLLVGSAKRVSHKSRWVWI